MAHGEVTDKGRRVFHGLARVELFFAAGNHFSHKRASPSGYPPSEAKFYPGGIRDQFRGVRSVHIFVK
jgi:hypothetical protein